MVRESALFASVLIMGMLLSITPLPDVARWVWPRWFVLILLSWAITRPNIQVGVWGWAAFGLVADILMETSMGQQMLAYAVLGWVHLYWRNSLGNTPSWQFIALYALVLLLILEGTSSIVDLFLGRNMHLDIASRTITGALITPLLCQLMSSRSRY